MSNKDKVSQLKTSHISYGDRLLWWKLTSSFEAKSDAKTFLHQKDRETNAWESTTKTAFLPLFFSGMGIERLLDPDVSIVPSSPEEWAFDGGMIVIKWRSEAGLTIKTREFTSNCNVTLSITRTFAFFVLIPCFLIVAF